MSTVERLKLVAPCGIDCGICELHVCRDDSRLFDSLIEKGIPSDKIPCEGCRSVKGNSPVIGATCETYLCVLEKKKEFCYQCDEFPCDKLHPAVDRADVLPHNMKVFNLCTIKKIGIDAFTETSRHIKKRYYTGKMEIGGGPQLK